MIRETRSNLFAAVLVLGAAAIGCGDDSDDKSASSGAAATAGDGAVGAPTQPGMPTAMPWSITATLVNILAVDATSPIAVPHRIVVLDNNTGLPLVPPVETTSAAGTGIINLTFPTQASYSLHVIGVGDPSDSSATYDTVLLNATPVYKDPLIRISSAGTASIAENSAAFKPTPDRAALVGAIYWAPGGVRKGTIGCATLFIDGLTAPSEDFAQRYNAPSGLPTTLDQQKQTATNGQFFFGQITKGAHTLRASLDNGASFIGAETKVFIPLSRAEASSPLKTLVVQAAVDIDVPANPTPAGCK